MAWRRPGDKPLSEPMMVSLLTHICVAWPQWVKGLLPDAVFLLLRFLFQISPDLKIIKTLFPTWFTQFHFSFTADFYGAINDVRCSDNWNFDLYMFRKRLFREQFFMQISRQTMRTALSYTNVILSIHVYNKDISKAKNKITVTITKYFHDDLVASPMSLSLLWWPPTGSSMFTVVVMLHIYSVLHCLYSVGNKITTTTTTTTIKWQ